MALQDECGRRVSDVLYPWRRSAGTIKLHIVLTPKSSRDSIEGMISVLGRGADSEQSALKVKVRAQPQGGAANQAAINLLSQAFNIPKSDISCIAGVKSKHKTFEFSGEVDENIKKIQNAIIPHKIRVD